MKVLIAAGPTQEPIDSLRYITNASSGKMGAALARAAVEKEWSVTVVSGPVGVDFPDSVNLVNVRTAREMADACLEELGAGFDVFISVAAIADFTPDSAAKGKISSGSPLTVNLVPTPKLLPMVKEKYPSVYCVGFKAEYDLGKDELIAKARSRLIEYGIDLIVANDVRQGVYGSDFIHGFIIDDFSVNDSGRLSKDELAKMIIDVIAGRKC